MSKQLDQLLKLDSRLRCVANGDTQVNVVRAEQSGAVQASPSSKAHQPLRRVNFDPELSVKTAPSIKALKRGKQKSLPDDIRVNVFVLFDQDESRPAGLIRRRRGRLGTASVTLSQLQQLDDLDDVQFIELAETLKAPRPFVGDVRARRPTSDLHAPLNDRKFMVRRGRSRVSDDIGKNVLLGVIDVGGIDFAHPDFIDENGDTRVIAIWDQGGDAFETPAKRGKKGRGFDYGSEITADDMRHALTESGRLRVGPHDLAPQSQQVPGSHATHVASIAAGNGGVCRNARIAAVMVSLPLTDLDRRHSFYDTTRLIDAVEYLLDVAEETKGIDAISINISLGTNGGGHDGSDMVSRWLESVLSMPGRAICVAAGNSGQEAPQYEGDLGHLSGRIHAAGKIPAADLRRDLDWMVVGDGVEDISENELEIWYGAEDELEISLRTPTGQWIGPVLPQQRVENLMLSDRTFVSIYNDLCDPKNGDNKISVYLSPYMKDAIVGVTPGRWIVRLTGRVVRRGEFHAWIERDDPGPVRLAGERIVWRFPSYFGGGTFIDSSSVSSLACGTGVIGVANLDEALGRIHATSSQGPTRDGRFKPDIAAPGTAIAAARGFDAAVHWVDMTGTSMASPYVAGVAGLMLSMRPGLTAAQVSSIIQRTSSPLPGASYEWQLDAGFGVVDPTACLKEVERLIKPTLDRTEEFGAKSGKLQ